MQGIPFSYGYLISTKIDDCGPCNGYIQFIRIDEFGDTMRTFNIPNFGDEQGPVSALYLADQHLIIAANNSNGINNQVTIINSDTLGNVFWHFTYSDSSYDYSANSMIQTDSAYLITGIKSYPSAPQLTRTFLLSVSKNGNFNWIKTYGDPLVNFATGLRRKINDIIITGSMFDTIQQKTQPFIVKVDTAGNVNQFKEIELPFDAAPTGIAGDDYSNYIYGYTVDSLLNTNAILIRLDMILDTVWTTRIDQGRFETARCGISCSDGGIILTNSVCSAGNTNGDILLSKYDSSGNTLFTKTIVGFDNEPFASSLIETQDQGFLIVTTSYNSLMHSEACAFKTDSLGDIISNILIPIQGFPLIYPNPSSGVFNLVNGQKPYQIELYNLEGRKLNEFKESKINITSYEDGIYIYKLFLETDKFILGKLIKIN